MKIDDVKNSEYIEEEEIKRFSVEQRSQFVRDSHDLRGTIDENVAFRMLSDGGTGGLDMLKKIMNRS